MPGTQRFRHRRLGVALTVCNGNPLHARFLLLTVLGACLEPAPGLSRSCLHGYLLLQTALPALG